MRTDDGWGAEEQRLDPGSAWLLIVVLASPFWAALLALLIEVF